MHMSSFIIKNNISPSEAYLRKLSLLYTNTGFILKCNAKFIPTLLQERLEITWLLYLQEVLL